MSDNTFESTEEKVLGPGAVLHQVDAAGNLEGEGTKSEPATEETVTDLGVPAAAPTPTPLAEPKEYDE